MVLLASTFFFLWIALPSEASSIIQCSPASKSCTLENYQGVWVDRQPCEVSSVVYPETEKEFIAAVAGAVERKQSIKVVSSFAHSLPKVACPRGNTGLLISTSKYDKNIVVSKDSKVVTVDAGVQLRDLFATLAQHELTLPVAPSFNGISVAGVISTGSHGSGLHGRGGALHEYVVGMTIIVPAKREEGYAKLVKITADDKDLNAAKLSLGVLGAISQVTFAVEPMFKRSVVKLVKNDSSLEDDILEIARKYDFGEINWHVSQGKTIHTLSLKVPVTTPGDGRLIVYTPRSGNSIKFFRKLAESEIASENRSVICASSTNNTINRVNTGDGLVNNVNNTFTGYPVVGFNNLMEGGGGCQNSSVTRDGDKLTCPWDTDLPGQVFFESELAIPLTKIKQAIRDIKSIRDKNPDKLCVLNMFGGAIFRFVRGSKAYLASKEDMVYFNTMLFRDRNVNTPTLDKGSVDEIQQMLLKKYKAIPHWGKGQNYEFDKGENKIPDLGKFLRVKQKLDPDGFFSSEWSDAVLGISKSSASTVRDGCGLEGLCICSKDSHCAPEKGYLCQSGVVYKNAKVCRKA